ncbi:MAG: hypothetical protein D4R48_04925 [Nitrosomonadales bacterium]|nr:MAG: hypothetical protein D4R48_04925 [Nitrosomonadales bacterium]
MNGANQRIQFLLENPDHLLKIVPLKVKAERKSILRRTKSRIAAKNSKVVLGTRQIMYRTIRSGLSARNGALTQIIHAAQQYTFRPQGSKLTANNCVAIHVTPQLLIKSTYPGIQKRKAATVCAQCTWGSDRAKETAEPD